jgi:hypothetical protein
MGMSTLSCAEVVTERVVRKIKNRREKKFFI